MSCPECRRLVSLLRFAKGDLEVVVRRLSGVAQRRPGSVQEGRLLGATTQAKEYVAEAKALHERHIAECEAAA